MIDFKSLTSYCHFLLNSYPAAQLASQYLDSRIYRNTQEMYQIGFMPPPHLLKQFSEPLDTNSLLKSKLLYQKYVEDSLGKRNVNINYFEHYPIIIPYHDLYGNIIAVVGRTLYDKDKMKELQIPKYKNSKWTDDNILFHKSYHLFNLHFAKDDIIKQDCVYIVEGQFDAIKGFETGFKNIVATGGADISSTQLSLLLRYTQNIFLLFDNDEAGLKGREKVKKIYSKYANFTDFYIPQPYKDLDEYCNTVKNKNDISFLVEQ